MGMKLWNLDMIHNKVTDKFPYYNYGDDLYIFAKDEDEARAIAADEMGDEVFSRLSSEYFQFLRCPSRGYVA